MRGYCELCKRYGETEIHHIFGGAYRKKSEKYGAVIRLCRACHNEPPNGVHFNKKKMDSLRAETQARIMKENGWDVDDFRREFGKNYLDIKE